jgi:hypothetical protein
MEGSKMFRREKRDPAESELDRLGSALVGASRATDDEVDAAISSPLLFSRIQAAIRREQRPVEANGSWLGLLSAAKLAVPAMALVALIAGSVPWSESKPMRIDVPQAAFEKDPVISSGRYEGIVSVAASACALSENQECAISSNEVLATIFAEENQEQPR